MSEEIKRANRFLTEDTEDLEEKEEKIEIFFKELGPDKQREIVDAVVEIGNAKEAEADKEGAAQPEEDENTPAGPQAPAAATPEETEEAGEAGELEALGASYIRNANRFLGEEEIKEEVIGEQNNESIEVFYKDIDSKEKKELIMVELLKALNAAQDDNYAKDKIKEELVKKALFNIQPEEVERLADVDAYTEEMVSNALENKPLISTLGSEIKENSGIII